MIVIVGSSNAVNLTDGLDGLAIVPIIIVTSTLAIISYLVGNSIFSNYLNLNYISGMGEVSIFCASLVGAGLGFLWFNAPPAKIFMGDTGSLAAGGAIGAISVMTRNEFVLAIAGGLFVLEAVSVIVQVLSFKLTGKRVFKMAPFHHHFEQKGMGRANYCNKVLDNFDNPSNDKFINIKNKMKIKKDKKETFKNILILGYGKTGKSIAEFFKKNKLNIYFGTIIQKYYD